MDNKKHLSDIKAWTPNGRALMSYWNGNKDSAVGIQMEDGSINWMPMSIYFRPLEEMPELETYALTICKGRILDVGAGAGAHSIILQNNGKDVTGLDIDEEAVNVMQQRGLKQTLCCDFLKLSIEHSFDTLLFLMNGIGVAGTLKGLKNYLLHAQKITSRDAQIILDSSNIIADMDKTVSSFHYLGEINYRLQFKDVTGPLYQWLYIDIDKLRSIASETNWNCQLIYEDQDNSYLARLTKN